MNRNEQNGHNCGHFGQNEHSVQLNALVVRLIWLSLRLIELHFKMEFWSIGWKR